MQKIIAGTVVLISITAVFVYGAIEIKFKEEEKYEEKKINKIIKLPEPSKKGKMSVEEAIQKRRSIRDYLDKPLTLKDISQILWAAQGITDPIRKFRAAPSAGATYPLEIYLVVKKGGVVNLSEGVYRYDPFTHSIELIKEGDFSYELYIACVNQEWVLKAPVKIVITAVYDRTTKRYGERGIRYVHMEAGHVGQNIYLQATALNLGTVAVGAFFDNMVEEIVNAKPNERALYVFPIGYRR